MPLHDFWFIEKKKRKKKFEFLSVLYERIELQSICYCCLLSLLHASDSSILIFVSLQYFLPFSSIVSEQHFLLIVFHSSSAYACVCDSNEMCACLCSFVCVYAVFQWTISKICRFVVVNSINVWINFWGPEDAYFRVTKYSLSFRSEGLFIQYQASECGISTNV